MLSTYHKLISLFFLDKQINITCPNMFIIICFQKENNKVFIFRASLFGRVCHILIINTEKRQNSHTNGGYTTSLNLRSLCRLFFIKRNRFLLFNEVKSPTPDLRLEATTHGDQIRDIHSSSSF